MTAIMQDIVERVQVLPERKQYEVWDMVSKLIDIISNDNYSDNQNVAYVDNLLTDEEKTIMAAARKEHKEHPENSTNLEDYMAERGITAKNLEKIRVIY